MSYQEFRPGRFQILPPVVKNILIITGILFLFDNILASTQQIQLSDYLGLHYFQGNLFKPYQFITYIFMHGGLGHIFFNMFALWTFGSVLENVWGSKRFLIFYLVTGLGAALIQLIVEYFQLRPVMETFSQLQSNMTIDSFENFVQSSEFQSLLNHRSGAKFNDFVEPFNNALRSSPSYALSLAQNFLIDIKGDILNGPTIVGASGSLFGLLIAFGMLFPNTIIQIYFLFPMKAKFFVIIYGGIELLSAIANNPGDNVAHFAHLGGMLFGFILIKIWGKSRNNFY